MDIENIRERRYQLEKVLSWATENDLSNTILPLGWRVCVSQERCALFDQENYLNGLIERDSIRTYNVPAHIEDQVQLILSKINNI